jgi:hypothetical protein
LQIIGSGIWLISSEEEEGDALWDSSRVVASTSQKLGGSAQSPDSLKDNNHSKSFSFQEQWTNAAQLGPAQLEADLSFAQWWSY